MGSAAVGENLDDGVEPRLSTSPDWEAIGHAVECPLCEYNLKGLSEPRCPECGFVFHWEEILDRTRHRHPYLFEHHPEKNFRSFVRTVVGGLLPWKFWKSLHPTQGPDLGRLWRYRTTVLAITWLPFVGAVLCSVWQLRGSGSWAIQWLNGSLLGPLEEMMQGRANIATALLEMTYPRTKVAKYIVFMTLVLLSLPTLTALPLWIFQATMREAKIQDHHVQRCIIYSYDVVVWPAIFVFVVAVSMAVGPLMPVVTLRVYGIATQVMFWSLLVMLPLVWLAMGIRLGFACRYYLRLKHAWAVAAVIEVIVGLLVFVLIVFVGQLLTHY